MKKLFLVLFIANISIASAALPPLYQSVDDLSSIAEILRGLGNSGLWVQSVDLTKMTATMKSGNKNCQITFQRKKESHGPGWAGPAAPLEIKSNNCK